MRVALVLIPLVLLSAGAGGVETPAADQASDGFFDAGRDGAVLELVDPAERGGFSEALADAGRNWVALADAVQSLEGDARAACVWLVNGMPHLDRLEMTRDALVEHVTYAYRARGEMPYPVPDDMFRPYILTYRIEDEPVEAWRKALYERYAPVAARERGVVATARAVSWDLAEAVSEREREFFGPRQTPLLTLRSRGGSKAEISILACAVMKALGIPSRQASVPALGEEKGGTSWIEIYDGKEWLPLYPLEPAAFGDRTFVERNHPLNVTIVTTRSSFDETLTTEAYSQTGTIELDVVRDGRPAAGYEHCSIAVLNDGALVPLDALETATDDRGRCKAIVGDGRYVVLAGSRDEAGDPFVTMREVVLEPGDTVKVELDVTPGPRGLDASRRQEEGTAGGLTALLVLDLGEEPSVRMLPLIGHALRGARSDVRVFCAVRGGGTREVENARQALGDRAQVVALAPGSASWQCPDGSRIAIGGRDGVLPIVRLCRGDGGTVILDSSGYDLNIEEKLRAAIGGAVKEKAHP
jgi:hypothetical protein